MEGRPPHCEWWWPVGPARGWEAATHVRRVGAVGMTLEIRTLSDHDVISAVVAEAQVRHGDGREGALVHGQPPPPAVLSDNPCSIWSITAIPPMVALFGVIPLGAVFRVFERTQGHPGANKGLEGW